MGFSELERVCKDHPYHDLNLGVCPSCLREKLSQIYAVASCNKPKTATDRPSYSSSASYSSASDWTHLSPVHRHKRNGSDILGSISFRVSLGNGLMKKSRSVAFVSRNVGGEAKHGNKKKRGFWSKFLHLKEKKDVNFDGKIVLNSGRLI